MRCARSILPDEEVLDALASGLRARLSALLMLALAWLAEISFGARRRLRNRVARLERSVRGWVLLRAFATIAPRGQRLAGAAFSDRVHASSAFRRLTRGAFARGAGLSHRLRLLLALLDDPTAAIAALARRLRAGLRRLSAWAPALSDPFPIGLAPIAIAPADTS